MLDKEGNDSFELGRVALRAEGATSFPTAKEIDDEYRRLLQTSKLEHAPLLEWFFNQSFAYGLSVADKAHQEIRDHSIRVNMQDQKVAAQLAAIPHGISLDQVRGKNRKSQPRHALRDLLVKHGVYPDPAKRIKRTWRNLFGLLK